MQLALEQALRAADCEEVPVGAVVVKDGQVIGRGHNLSISQHDPTAHAEIVAIRQAAKNLGNYRLEGCSLYVTLEPCVMCAGAMLHARLDQVVFGAFEPKTGASGSVLKHQTKLVAGVMAQECGDLLKQFFAGKRINSQPLRQDALRTPDQAFANLSDYAWSPIYRSDLKSLQGLRLHYLDLPADKPGNTTHLNPKPVWLCLHDQNSWSYEFRQLIPALLNAGHRVVAPDLIGFGKSDKPKKKNFHRFDWHRQVLLELIEALDLQQIRLVGRGLGMLLALSLPMSEPERYQAVFELTTTTDACADAYNAPFPDKGHRAAVEAFSGLSAQLDSEPLASLARQTSLFWADDANIECLHRLDQRDDRHVAWALSDSGF
jgi:tRNA(adenine34) deaminase